jgi:hypothetical protein
VSAGAEPSSQRRDFFFEPCPARRPALVLALLNVGNALIKNPAIAFFVEDAW